MGPWLRSQNQTWYVQIGKRRFNLGKNKRAAFREYHRLMGSGAALFDTTVREVLDDYWKWLVSNRSPETYQPRKAILVSFGESIPSRLRVRQLQPLHVQRWIDDNYSTNGPTRRNNLITTIKTVFNWAVKMGYCSANPIAAMEKPTRTVRQEFIPFDQWGKLLDAAKDVDLALAAGLLPSCVLDLHSHSTLASRWGLEQLLIFNSALAGQLEITEIGGSARSFLWQINGQSFPAGGPLWHFLRTSTKT